MAALVPSPVRAANFGGYWVYESTVTPQHLRGVRASISASGAGSGWVIPSGSFGVARVVAQFGDGGLMQIGYGKTNGLAIGKTGAVQSCTLTNLGIYTEKWFGTNASSYTCTPTETGSSYNVKKLFAVTRTTTSATGCGNHTTCWRPWFNGTALALAIGTTDDATEIGATNEYSGTTLPSALVMTATYGCAGSGSPLACTGGAVQWGRTEVAGGGSWVPVSTSGTWSNGGGWTKTGTLPWEWSVAS